MRTESSRNKPLVSFFGLALLVHLQAILVAVVVLSMHPEGCSVPPDLPLGPMEVALVPSSATAPPEEALKEELKKEEKEERRMDGQVVELPRPRDERRPDDAKYLSEYDSSVERQMKAARRSTRPGKMARRPSREAVWQRKRRSSPQQREEQKEEPSKLAMRARPRVPRSRLSPSPLGEEASALEQSGRTKHQPLPPERLAQGALSPTDQELAQAVGGHVADALQEVEEGEQTLLNSRRWRFASFFNRVKRQVAQNWHPDRVYRRRDPAGNVYGFKDRLTILRVKLSPRGELKNMHVEKPSGLGFLDDEAMSAFRLAEPFPNPPRGLVDDATGLISFRFGFLFEISRRSNFRIMRFRN